MSAFRPIDALVGRVLTFDVGDRAALVGQGDPSAVSTEGDPSRPALLAFHGFAGTPLEVKVLTDVAARLGLSARAPRLTGHTDDVRDLMNAGWADWASDAKKALFDLRRAPTGKAIVGGLSLGALLATYLAATEPERVAGLVVLANAAWLRMSSYRLPLGLLERIGLFHNRFYLPEDGADIRDPLARSVHRTYQLNPVRSAIEVLRAGRAVRALLPKVRCPTLVIHGQLDRVCPVDNAKRFAEGIGSSDVRVRIMPGSAHIVSLDVDRDEVDREIEMFVSRLSGA